MSVAAVAAAAEPLTSTLRQQIALVAPNQAEAAIETLLEAMKATKRGSGMCRKCGTRVEVEVQDANAATNALKLLIEQTEGRPGVADQAEQDQLVINRTVYTTVSAEQALALLDAGDLDGLRAELQSSLPL